VRFPERGIIGIEGKNLDKPILDTNAVGKTLIFDMISYALYGEVLRKKAANIIGPFSSDMLLSVAFYLPSLGKSMIVKRERRGPNETVKVKIDGKMYDGRPRKMQPIINRLLGIEWLTFQNCILYGDSRESNFVYVGYSKRTEILAQIANILHLREARKLISPDLRYAEKDLSHLEGQITALKEAKEKAKHNLEAQKKRLVSIETEQKEEEEKLILRRKNATDKLERIDAETLKKVIKDKNETIEERDYRKSRYREEMKEIKKIEPKKQLQEIVKEQVILGTLKKKKEEDIEKIKEVGECPTCSTELDVIDINKLQEKIHEIPKELFDKEKFLRETIARYKDLQAIIEEINEENMKLLKEINTLEQRIDETETLKTQIKSITRELESRKDLREEIETNVKIAEEDHDMLSEKFMKRVFEKKNKKADRDALKYWNEKFSPRGAEAELIMDLVKELQSFANNYSHKLTDGSISVYITPEKETAKGIKKSEITIDVIENDESKDFDLYSGGQKNRIEKAIRLGLMKILPHDIGFKLFDEIGKDLSTKGYEEVLKLMREIFDGEQIFLVTNDRESKKLFDHRMTVILEDGQSTIDCSWKSNEEEENE
jgi:DNA repair exonuclease SbcCD ATPase subunit